MVKQVLVTFDYNERTRWLYDDKALADFVRRVASESVRWETEGDCPSTSVWPVPSQIEIVPHGATVHLRGQSHEH